jgi:hypothetical protein
MRCHHFALSPGGAHIPSSTPPHVPPIALPDNRFLSLSRFISFEHMQPPTHTCTHNEMGALPEGVAQHAEAVSAPLVRICTLGYCDHASLLLASLGSTSFCVTTAAKPRSACSTGMIAVRPPCKIGPKRYVPSATGQLSLARTRPARHNSVPLAGTSLPMCCHPCQFSLRPTTAVTTPVRTLQLTNTGASCTLCRARTNSSAPITCTSIFHSVEHTLSSTIRFLHLCHTFPTTPS